MRKILAVALTVVMLIIPLTGCSAGIDLDEQIFAINMALDTGATKTLRLTVQYPQITPVGKESTTTSDSDLEREGYLIEQVEGDDLSSCLTLLRLVTPRSISLMQLRGLFISESLAGDHDTLNQSIETLLSTHNTRPAVSVYVTLGRAEDVLKAQVPLFGARLSKSQTSQDNELKRQGVIPSAPLNDFYFRLTDEDRSSIAVLAAVNNMQYLSTPPNQGSQTTSLLAGELPRNTVNSIDYCGSVVLNRDGMLYLDGYETQLFNMLTGKLLTLDMQLNGTTVTLGLRRPPRIKYINEQEGPCISIRFAVVCETPDPQPYIEQFKEDIALLLLKLQQSGQDPIGFAQFARMHALTFESWKQMDWETIYPQLRFSIDAR